MPLTNYELWSFQDLVDHVLDVFVTANQSAKNTRSAVRAVLDAYHEVGNARNWSYLYRRFPITTVAQQIAGTIAYTHATRTVTLTGATFPADAIWYEISVNKARYEIERFVDATHVILSERTNPGADLAAGTAYILYRDKFPLPDDFVEFARQLIDIQTPGASPLASTLDDLLFEGRVLQTSNMPRRYAKTRGVIAGGQAVIFGPPPSESRNYDAFGRFRPRALKVLSHTIGTVALTNGSTTVTGTASAFVEDHVGCLLRVSANDKDLPTSIVGSIDGRSNRAVFEAVVLRRISAISLEIDRAPSEDLTTRKYTLSSRLDIEAGAMLNYLQRLAEAKFALLDNRTDGLAKRLEYAELEFGKAAAADDPLPLGTMTTLAPTRLPDVVQSVTY